MKAFTVHAGLVAPMDRANVDTDMIIPKQFLKSIKRSGFGKNCFDELRYLDEGQPDESCEGRPVNPEFPLNLPRYQGASRSSSSYSRNMLQDRFVSHHPCRARKSQSQNSFCFCLSTTTNPCTNPGRVTVRRRRPLPHRG